MLTLVARRFAPEASRATLTAVFVLLDAISIVLFAAVGAITGQTLVAAGCALPPLVAGGALGWRVRRLLPPQRFRQLTLVLLTGASFATLLPAVLVGPT